MHFRGKSSKFGYPCPARTPWGVPATDRRPSSRDPLVPARSGEVRASHRWFRRVPTPDGATVGHGHAGVTLRRHKSHPRAPMRRSAYFGVPNYLHVVPQARWLRWNGLYDLQRAPRGEADSPLPETTPIRLPTKVTDRTTTTRRSLAHPSTEGRASLWSTAKAPPERTRPAAATPVREASKPAAPVGLAFVGLGLVGRALNGLALAVQSRRPWAEGEGRARASRWTVRRGVTVAMGSNGEARAVAAQPSAWRVSVNARVLGRSGM